MKRCVRCGEMRATDRYRPSAATCRDCDNARQRERYANDPKFRRDAIDRGVAWGRAHPEKGRALSRKWRERNRDLVRERKRRAYAENGDEIGARLRDNAYRKKYGVTLAERDQMAVTQGHACAICGVPEDRLSKRLAVDHDHATGRVRALLCEACNVGLGRFRDDASLLERAAVYLRDHATSETESAG